MFFSPFRKLLDKWWSASPKRPRRHAARGHRARLGLEVLENRFLPAGFSVIGNQLLITGTPDQDVFTFTAGDTPVVTLNDESFTVDPAEVQSVVFDGMGGGDLAALTDTTGFENELALHPNYGTLTGANYFLELDNVANIAAYGSVNSSALLFGSADGTNVFAGTSNDSSLTGPDGGVLEAVNFGYVYAYSGTTADVATLIGSSTETNSFDGSSLIGNETYQVQTYGFSQVTAVAGTANDGAYLFADATAPNTFEGYADHATLSNSNTQATAYGFRYVNVHAGTASDTAALYGSPFEANTFQGGAYSSTLTGADYWLEADGFAGVSATAGTTSDVASLSAPTTGTNIFTVAQNNGYLSGGGYSLAANGFTTLHGYAGTSLDEAHFYDPRSSAGPRHSFVGTQYYSVLNATDAAGVTPFVAEADNFKKVYATGSGALTSAKQATSVSLYGSPTAGNVFNGGPTSSRLYGRGYSLQVDYFVKVSAYSSASTDTANLYGSTTTQNYFGAYPGNSNGQNYGILMNGGNQQVALGFRYVYAYAGTTADTANFYNFTGSPSVLVGTSAYTYEQEQDGAVMKYHDRAVGFRSVSAQAGTAQDVAYLYGASTGKNTFSASPPVYGGSLGYATMSGSGFSINLTAYHTIFAYAGTAADVAYLYGKYRVNYPSSYGYVYGADYLFEANSFKNIAFYNA